MINKTIKYLVIIIISITTSYNAFGQEYSAADEYYYNNIQTELPSENYYNKNLRAGGWDDDDPSGSGVGDNTGVGNVSVGNVNYSLLLGVFIYCFWIIRKRVRVRS